MDNNAAENWNDEEVRRTGPHSMTRIYLKAVGLVACAWTFFRGWEYCAAEPQLNIRCLYISQSECLGVEQPGFIQIFSFGIHIFMYIITPLISFLGQLHHIAICLKPSLWKKFSKVKFCNYHRGMYIPLFHTAYLTAIDAISSMTLVGAKNPMDPEFEDFGLFFYALYSMTAMLSFALVLQFPIYKALTVFEERLCSIRRNEP